MNYFLKIDSEPEIQINFDELIRRIKSKEIPSHSMLKSGNGGEWRPLQSYPEFSYLIPSQHRTSILAILSLVCGLISFGGGTIYSAIPAIILGRISLRKIKNDTNLKGDFLAKSGIAMGYVMLIIIFILSLLLLLEVILDIQVITKFFSVMR
jgi:hypothetical protein